MRLHDALKFIPLHKKRGQSRTAPYREARAGIASQFHYADELAPLRDLGAHERTELLGWIADDDETLSREPFHGVGIFQDLGHRLVHVGNDGFRHLRRSEQREPGR